MNPSDFSRLRACVLNLPVLGLFVCAWISDRWPELMVPALAAAFLIAGLQLLLVWLFTKRGKTSNDREVGSTIAMAEERTVVAANPFEATLDTESFEQFFHSRVAANHARMMEIRRLHRMTRPRASRVVMWSNELHMPPEFRALSMALENERKKLAVTKDWEVVPHGPDAFSIDAGAFAIEHFGGQTNIRIRDPSKVTVEGVVRGTVPAGNLPPEVRTANYH